MSRKWVSESISILYVIGRDLITTTKSSTEDEEYDNFDWEWLFHVVIVPVFQAWWKMINFWWIAIDLWTSVETVELDGTRPKNYPILIRIWSNSVGFLVQLTVYVTYVSWWADYFNSCSCMNIQNNFLNPSRHILIGVKGGQNYDIISVWTEPDWVDVLYLYP